MATGADQAGLGAIMIKEFGEADGLAINVRVGFGYDPLSRYAGLFGDQRQTIPDGQCVIIRRGVYLGTVALGSIAKATPAGIIVGGTPASF